MRIAAVDVGTNAAKLLIADIGSRGRLEGLAARRRMIRLGEGVDASGEILPAAMERLIAALKEYEQLAQRFGADMLVFAGTSASRDAPENLAETVRARTGRHYEILSGEDEAFWSFKGAMADLPEWSGPSITCDIGGGSTEIVLGGGCGTIHSRYSLNIGSVRVTERLFATQPPSADEITAATELISRALDACDPIVDKSALLVGASDTHRLLLNLLKTHPDDSRQLRIQDILTFRKRVLSMNTEEVLAMDPPRLAGRADVFPTAVLICSQVMRWLRKESIFVSRWGLCHGLVLREAQLKSAAKWNARVRDAGLQNQ